MCEMQSKDESTFDIWLQGVLQRYVRLSDKEKSQTLDSLFVNSHAEQILELNYKIPQFLQRDFITTLPLELSEKILSFVGGHDLLRCCIVNSHWNALISNYSKLWRASCIKLGIHPSEFDESYDKNRNKTNRLSLTRVFSRGSADRRYADEKSLFHPVSPEFVMEACWEYKDKFVRLARFRERLKAVSKDSVVTQTLRGHTSRVTCMYQHGRIIATGSDDRTVTFWSVTTGQRERTIICSYCVSCLVFNGSLLVAGAFMGVVKSWLLPAATPHQTYAGDSSTIVAVQLARSPRGDLVLTLSLYGKIKISVINTATCVFVGETSSMINDAIKKSMYIKVIGNTSRDVVYSVVLYVESVIVINRVINKGDNFSVCAVHVNSETGDTMKATSCQSDDACIAVRTSERDCEQTLSRVGSNVEYMAGGLPYKECIPICLGERFVMLLRLRENCLAVNDAAGNVWTFPFNKMLSGLQLSKRPIYCVGGNHFLDGIRQTHDTFFATSNAADIILWTFKFR